MQEGFLHATAGYTTPDEEMDLDYIAGEGCKANITCALTNSLGFGGHNASLLIKKYVEE